MDNRLDYIFRRRSIRKYTTAEVSEADIKALLEAGMAAPTASNLQPWHFVTITERTKLNMLAEAHPYGKMLWQAPLAIAVCCDPAISDRYFIQDGAAATENILIAAAGLGLGAVWLGCYPRPEREDAIRKVIGIPEPIRIVSVIAIGRPGEFKPARTQYNEKKVHRNKW